MGMGGATGVGVGTGVGQGVASLAGTGKVGVDVTRASAVGEDVASPAEVSVGD